MKIAIIGGGWFGCHLGLKLKEWGHRIDIFEKNNKLFSGASTYNQSRLHRGFHYPRSYSTRKQCSDTFFRFLHTYKRIVKDVKSNIYCISRDNSLLDFQTYLVVLNDLSLPYTQCEASEYGITNVEGSILTDEKLIMAEDAEKFFAKKLAGNIHLNKEILKIHNKNGLEIDGTHYDLCLNCTYNQFHPIKNLRVVYEVSMLLVYKKITDTPDIAITVMDGNFVSLYPLKGSRYTLSSVEHTPLASFESVVQARNFKTSQLDHLAMKNKPIFEALVCNYYPQFKINFQYESYFVEIKTKINSINGASRECIIARENNFIHFLSGKINNIFIAEDALKKIVG
jgi:hypothetical protein